MAKLQLHAGNSDPPKNYTEWGELIGALGQHMVAKYGNQVASEMFFEARDPLHVPNHTTTGHPKHVHMFQFPRPSC